MFMINIGHQAAQDCSDSRLAVVDREDTQVVHMQVGHMQAVHMQDYSWVARRLPILDCNCLEQLLEPILGAAVGWKHTAFLAFSAFVYSSSILRWRLWPQQSLSQPLLPRLLQYCDSSNSITKSDQGTIPNNHSSHSSNSESSNQSCTPQFIYNSQRLADLLNSQSKKCNDRLEHQIIKDSAFSSFCLLIISSILIIIFIVFLDSMSDPYNWHYPQRNQTMFMATIQNSFHQQKSMRESSFLKTDIPGAQPKRQIPHSVNRQNYSNSTFIEPIPQSHIMKNKFIQTNNLRTRDIQYAYPQCNQFKTARITNPLAPRYKLPYVPPVDPEPPRNLLRNTLDITDIQTKNKHNDLKLPQKQPIEGTNPKHLFRTVNAVNRLEVKDINTDGLFISERRNNPTNPLQPSYSWRDQRNSLNQSYGDIGSRPRQVILDKVNKRDDLSLGIYDIQGAQANSTNQRKYFLTKRKQYREINRVDDIAKTNASSLKKGITTKRSVNPLMPRYQYPEK